MAEAQSLEKLEVTKKLSQVKLRLLETEKEVSRVRELYEDLKLQNNELIASVEILQGEKSDLERAMQEAAGDREELEKSNKMITLRCSQMELDLTLLHQENGQLSQELKSADLNRTYKEKFMMKELEFEKLQSSMSSHQPKNENFSDSDLSNYYKNQAEALQKQYDALLEGIGQHAADREELLEDLNRKQRDLNNRNSII